jgi:hypothetical protein
LQALPLPFSFAVRASIPLCAGRSTTSAKISGRRRFYAERHGGNEGSWKRGSSAVSILTMRRTTSAISLRTRRDAMRAPVLVAFPAERT